MEFRVGLDRILDRLSNLRLDPDEPAPIVAAWLTVGSRNHAKVPERSDSEYVS